jgi:propionate CoA-transferase
LRERYFADVTRYTTSAFLRMKVGTLQQHDAAPHIDESESKALEADTP